MKMNIKKTDINSIFSSDCGSRKLILISGTGIEMLTHSAFGECDVCRFTWTLVWTCSGIFGGAHPEYFGIGNPAGFSGKYVRGFIIKSAV